MKPSIQYLRECFDYFPESGKLTWKTRPVEHFKDTHAMNAWNARYAGQEAGCLANRGYKQCRILRGLMRNHTIAWALHYGEFPTIVDHIDRNPLNNAIANLRVCTCAENSRNTVRKNALGFKGVRKSGRKFTAQITVSMQRIHLGSFDTAELAHQAYCRAADKYHGEFANYGNVKNDAIRALRSQPKQKGEGNV
jgi:hypothetical protein